MIDSSGHFGSINGLRVNGGSLTLDSITVRESTDAGLRADHVQLDVRNTIFRNNANSAIVTEKNANGTIDNTTFRNNSKTALYNKESSLTVKNSLFENNSGNMGGAINTHCAMTVDNCNIHSNSAVKGGGIFADYKTTITNSSICNNTATSDGGGVYCGYRGSGYSESFTVKNTKLTGNSSGCEGGALWCDSMNYLTMSDVEMTNNKAVANGGGLYAQKGYASACDPIISGKMTIINNSLTNGTASNAFLGENTTSKCIFRIIDTIDSTSRIGITSNTTDKTLDVVKIWHEGAYNNTANVFSYDTSSYRINRYNPILSSCYFVEIVRY